MRIAASSLALAGLTIFATVSAQETAPSGPSKELAQLKTFEGSWNCAGNVPAGPLGPAHKSSTHVKFHKDLDGVWYSGRIEENKTADNPHPLKGVAHWTYDAAGKKFVGVWVDNYGTWSTQTSAGWEADKLVWLGDAMMNGKTTGARDTFTKKGAELLHVGEFEMDGKWVTVQDETCKRPPAKK